jgi:chitinase
MVWAVDLDDTDGTSTSYYLGFGKANNVSSSLALDLKTNHRLAREQATNINSCYWTFCGGDCASGYFPETYANGQVNGVSSNTVCEGGEYQTLCCASGTNTGTCSWNGWNGVGLSCSGECEFALVSKKRGLASVAGPVAIAFNSKELASKHLCSNTNSCTANSLGSVVGLDVDRVCNGKHALHAQKCPLLKKRPGGYQTYCCDGFRAAPKGAVSSLDLIGEDGEETKKWELDKGRFAGLTAACVAGATAAATAAGKHPSLPHHHDILNANLGTAAVIFSLGIGFLPTFTATFAAVFATCDLQAKEAAIMHAVGVVAGRRTGGRIQKPGGGLRPKPVRPKVPQAVKVTILGQWTSKSYDPKIDLDCAVTYTCRYGRGYDEVSSCSSSSNEKWH